ncbi:MAG TPA: 4-hydroxy-tetrahydrodipicolinate reductase [Rubricoccaceae bacterium]|jgi:4-hydroxy-tetrahydrodipicolinate reductase
MPDPLQIALVGTGRMGQAVEAVAQERGHAVVARFDALTPFLDAPDPSTLNGADVVVDFSDPSVALAHVERVADWGVQAVVGTTGWTADLDRVRERVEAGGGAVVWAPNFSLGVALVVRALRGMLPLLDRLEGYDAYVHEVHHTAKLDSPSGTALRLAEELVAGLARKTRVEAETVHGRIDPAALHVTSTRAGHVFGEHTVGLDSAVDQIEVVHRAKDRRAFASGAVASAEWVVGRRGLFTLDDVLGG